MSGITAECVVIGSDQRKSTLVFHASAVLDCGAEGVEAHGIFDWSCPGCAFARNGHEGFEVDDFTVFPLEQSDLLLRRCVFSDNLEEGADIDFNERDPFSGSSSEDGLCRLVIDRCRFEYNGTDGLLCDVDFDPADEVGVQTLIQRSEFRGNASAGLLLDTDLPALFVLAGNRCSANRGAGLLVTSDPGRATLMVANHFDVGSALQGVALVGPSDVYLSHVAVFGAGGPAVSGAGTAALHNGALFGSPAPEQCRVEFSYTDLDLDGPGNFSGELELTRVPDQFFFTPGSGTKTRFALPSGSGLASGDLVEIDDDGVARTIVSIQSGLATFEPAAGRAVRSAALITPLEVAEAREDFALIEGSEWLDAGDPVEVDADASITDVGVLGGVLQDFASRRAERIPFVVERLLPGIGPVTGPVTLVQARCTRSVDPQSVDEDSFEVLLDGQPVDGTISVSQRTLQFVPDSPIASGALEIALHSAIRDLADEALELPLRWTCEIEQP